ncbi:MAG: endonuclease domain-containing protein [Bauldia sp.]|nr:endonuclease domain-containing protein [Bauldia sp.]
MPHSNIRPKTRRQAQRLRRDLTEAEKKLWRGLREMPMADGFHWRRQVPIGSYIADFACLKARLILEADGDQHADSLRDETRDAWLASQGFRVVRLWNIDILQNLDGCMATVSAALADAERDNK